jgi:hypothetical protein
MQGIIPILIGVTGSLIGVLILALIAKLVAYAFRRPDAWQRCLQVLLVLGIAALLGAIVVPNCVKARSHPPHKPCVSNLRLIKGAKAVWALEMKKPPADTPRDADLFGPAQYIREKPTCPEGGGYLLGTVAEKPRCSLGGRHSLD